jgi:hypothetical protein
MEQIFCKEKKCCQVADYHEIAHGIPGQQFMRRFLEMSTDSASCTQTKTSQTSITHKEKLKD